MTVTRRRSSSMIICLTSFNISSLSKQSVHGSIKQKYREQQTYMCFLPFGTNKLNVHPCRLNISQVDQEPTFKIILEELLRTTPIDTRNTDLNIAGSHGTCIMSILYNQFL